MFQRSCGTWSLLVFLLLVVPRSTLGQEGFQEFEFERLNRTYSAFINDLSAIELDLATIQLSSPEHSLTIQSHRATLRPHPDGGHGTQLEVQFSGSGKLEAEVKIGRAKGHLEDEVTVPLQPLTLQGRLGVERGEEGYLVTLLDVQDEVEVEIQSRLAGQLFSLCHQLSLVLVKVDCRALERSLSRIKVPLPLVGETYLLSHAELTAEDRRRLDDYFGFVQD